MIEKAIEFATRKHEGQVRKYTGIPYIKHPEEVAGIMERYGRGEAAIVAAWLHDTVEDTDATLAEVREIFGAEVAEIVDFLTDIESEASLREVMRHTGWRAERAIEEVKTHSKKTWLSADLDAVIKLNSPLRNVINLERLRRSSSISMDVKLGDMISNSRDITKHDANFARTYLPKMDLRMDAIQGRAHLPLFEEAAAVIHECFNYMKLGPGKYIK